MNSIELIKAERERQVSAEGWTPEHDDTHKNGEIARAAIPYTEMAVALTTGNDLDGCVNLWPWGEEWWKPSQDPVRNLVKAAALIAAEIDRLQRLSANAALSNTCPKGSHE